MRCQREDLFYGWISKDWRDLRICASPLTNQCPSYETPSSDPFANAKHRHLTCSDLLSPFLPRPLVDTPYAGMLSIAPSASLLRLDNPTRSLTLAFWLWKALLFVVIAVCPGPGYDTSTSLITFKDAAVSISNQSESCPRPLKFARWDSVYFLHSAEYGYVFEQEWAFGYPRVLGLFMSGRYFNSFIYETRRS